MFCKCKRFEFSLARTGIFIIDQCSPRLVEIDIWIFWVEDIIPSLIAIGVGALLIYNEDADVAPFGKPLPFMSAYCRIERTNCERILTWNLECPRSASFWVSASCWMSSVLMSSAVTMARSRRPISCSYRSRDISEAETTSVASPMNCE